MSTRSTAERHERGTMSKRLLANSVQGLPSHLHWFCHLHQSPAHRTQDPICTGKCLERFSLQQTKPRHSVTYRCDLRSAKTRTKIIIPSIWSACAVGCASCIRMPVAGTVREAIRACLAAARNCISRTLQESNPVIRSTRKCPKISSFQNGYLSRKLDVSEANSVLKEFFQSPLRIF